MELTNAGEERRRCTAIVLRTADTAAHVRHGELRALAPPSALVLEVGAAIASTTRCEHVKDESWRTAGG